MKEEEWKEIGWVWKKRHDGDSFLDEPSELSKLTFQYSCFSPEFMCDQFASIAQLVRAYA